MDTCTHRFDFKTRDNASEFAAMIGCPGSPYSSEIKGTEPFSVYVSGISCLNDQHEVSQAAIKADCLTDDGDPIAAAYSARELEAITSVGY